MTDGPCDPGERSFVASTTAVDAVTFIGSQILIVPAGGRFVLYGPVEGGGRLENLHDREVRIDDRFAVVENYLSTTGGPPDPGSIKDRDLVVIDLVNLRHAEMSGLSLQDMKLTATATTLTIDGGGCHYETPTAPIP